MYLWAGVWVCGLGVEMAGEGIPQKLVGYHVIQPVSIATCVVSAFIDQGDLFVGGD